MQQWPNEFAMGNINRRRFLVAGAALGGCLAAAPALAQSRGRRVVIVGAGWAGLTVARALRRSAADLDVTVVDRSAEFRSLPLSNAWLVGLGAEPRRQDHAATAVAFGYRFVQAEVTSIDRERRVIATRDGTLAYDWLVLAPGVRNDYTAWFGNDTSAAAAARERYPAGVHAEDLAALKRKIAEFKGGDFAMVLPPGPSRCPPAPYERAVMAAWAFRRRGLKARILVIDPGGGMQAFNRVFAERYADMIVHMTHAQVKAVDPFRRTIATEFDNIGFDDAILMPPQQAADLAWRAGLVAESAERPSAWAAIDPLRLNVPGDERVFLAGDLIDRVSPLFGQYPKNGHVASRLGRIVAGEIAARSRGETAAVALPESVCHVFTDVDPRESVRLEAEYRLRGDGVITQAVRQHNEPQPRGEAEAWARSMYAEFLAPEGG